MKRAVSLLLLVATTLVDGGFLTGHHPYPAVISRTIISGAVGGGPTNGAYSSSQSSQTVSSPAQVQSSISTFHPTVAYGYSGRQNQGGQNGQGQGRGGYNYGYETINNPSVLAYGTYGFGQGQNGQGQSGQGSYGGQGQGQGGYGGQGGYSGQGQSNQNQGQGGSSNNNNNGGGQGVGYSTRYNNYGHY